MKNMKIKYAKRKRWITVAHCTVTFCCWHVEQICRLSKPDWKAATDCEKSQSEQCWYSSSHVIQHESDWKASAGSRDWQSEPTRCQLFSTRQACCSWALTRSREQLRSDSGTGARAMRHQALDWACAWAFHSQHVQQVCRNSRSSWKAAAGCEKSQSEQCQYSFSHVIQQELLNWKANAGSTDWQSEQNTISYSHHTVVSVELAVPEPWHVLKGSWGQIQALEPGQRDAEPLTAPVPEHSALDM